MASEASPRPFVSMLGVLPLALALVLSLAACGEPEHPAPVPDPVSDPVPVPEKPEADTPKPEDGWPGIDDDPSLDREDGSGIWCGTGMGWPHGPDPYLEVRVRGSVVIIPAGGGDPIVVTQAWSEPDAAGIRRRYVRERLGAADVARLEKRKRAALERARAARSFDEARMAEAEMDDIDQRLQLAPRGWVQCAVSLDGTTHESKPGESELAFLQRARREADAAKKDAAKGGGR